VTEEAVKNYYEKFITEFQTTDEVNARHILIRPDAGIEDTAEAKEKARNKAREILDMVKAGVDFSEIAKTHSQDTGSAARGGDLGYFAKGVMVRPFEEAAFKLAIGEVSGLVETMYGFHIIKVEDIKKARTLSLEEAAEKIKKQLSEQGAIKVGWEKMTELRRVFQETGALEELKAAASREGIKASETGLFSEADLNVEIAASPTLKTTAFLLDKGEVSGVLEVSGGLYLITVLERVEEHVPPYEDISERVKQALKREKALELAKDRAGEFLQRLKQGEELEGLAKKENHTVSKSGLFSKKDGVIPDIGIFLGNNDALFELKKDAPYFSEVLPRGDSFYILKLKDSEEADVSQFEGEKERLRTAIVSDKQQKALSEWIDELRARAKVTINEELL
jgi:peptidyl-prolyl cis-trans isomerase D